MRIAFAPAARVLSATEPNGEALIAVSLLRALAARGHEIVAWCERADLSIPGVEIREVSADGPTVGLGRLAFAKRIARDAARERFDVAHVLFPFTTSDGYSLVSSAPLVVGPVNVPWPRGARAGSVPSRAAALLVDQLERRKHAKTLARASRILVTGPSARNALPPSLHDRCEDVPFGIDTARFAATPLPDEPVILFLSVLDERKGIGVLMDAMPAILSRAPRARLVIAGADPHGLRPSLEERARALGVLDRLDLVGPVDPADVPSLYERCRVFCQPSYGEPFGMTVLEAMASRRPVVGTSGGGIPDAVVENDGGRLVAPGDATALASAIAGVLARPRDAERMAAFNRARAEDRYALDVVVDRIESVYRAVTARSERVDVAS